MGWLRESKSKIAYARARRRMDRLFGRSIGSGEDTAHEQIVGLCLKHPGLIFERFPSPISFASCSPLHFLVDVKAKTQTIKTFCEAYPEALAYDDGYRYRYREGCCVNGCFPRPRAPVEEMRTGLLPLHVACQPTRRFTGSDVGGTTIAYLAGKYPAAASKMNRHGELPIRFLLERGSDTATDYLTLLGATPSGDVDRHLLEFILGEAREDVACVAGEFVARRLSLNQEEDLLLHINGAEYSHQEITKSKIAALGIVLPQVREIRIEAPWEVPAWTDFMANLQTNKSVKTLCIKDTHDTLFSNETACEAFLKMLEANTSIEALTIQGEREKQPNANIMKGIASAIERGQLQSLSLSFDDSYFVLDMGVIIQSLTHNARLEELSFSMDDLPMDSITSRDKPLERKLWCALGFLAQVLEEDNTTLQDVSFSGPPAFRSSSTVGKIMYYASLNRFGRAKVRNPNTTPAEFLDLICDVYEGHAAGFSQSCQELLRLNEFHGLLRESPSALYALLAHSTSSSQANEGPTLRKTRRMNSEKTPVVKHEPWQSFSESTEWTAEPTISTVATPLEADNDWLLFDWTTTTEPPIADVDYSDDGSLSLADL